MRKLLILSTTMLACLLLVSCNKEGQYTPKNKIEKVYYSSSSKSEMYQDGAWNTVYEANSPKYLEEVWNWDGKLLKSISYYNPGGEVSYTENFEYDGKRLVAISCGDDDRYVVNYEKRKMSSIDYYNGTEKELSYEFAHEGGKITKIKIIEYDGEKGIFHPLSFNVLRFFIPSADKESFVKLIAGISENKNAKGAYTSEVHLEWDGKNVSKITYADGSYSSTDEYTYDNKLNPYCGLFYIEEFEMIDVLSKNNVTQHILNFVDNGDSHHEERNYEYTYDGKVPTMQTCTYTESIDILRQTYSYSYYFEYK